MKYINMCLLRKRMELFEITLKENVKEWLIVIAVVLFYTSIIGSGCMPKESIERKAYDDINNELSASGYPVGMFGTRWFMSSNEVQELFGDCYQSGPNTLAIKREVYGRSAKINYFFTDDKLLFICISFADQFDSIDKFSEAFYKVQNNLDDDYGQSFATKVSELIPPVNNVWIDQKFIVNEIEMGKVILTHQLTIQDNTMGEQIIMYLSE